MKIIAIIYLLLTFNIFAQSQSFESNCECDSLFKKYEAQLMLDILYSKIYKFRGNWDSLKIDIENEVREIAPIKEKYLLLVGLVIDTLGNVKCIKKYEGISKLVDCIVMEKMKKLKFDPMELRNKKIEMLARIPLINKDRKSFLNK
jgi:hypothetical protein